MYSFNTGFNRIVDHCVGNAACFQYSQSLIGFAPQIFELPKLDGFRWARLGAGRLQSRALSIRTESTLERAAIGFIFFHYTKGTSNNTVGAAIAYVRLNENRSKLHAYDCAGGTCFKAASYFAMLADIGRKAPCRQLLGGVTAAPDLRSILYKLYMTPCGMPDGHGVVIGISAPLKAVFSQLVPFLAR